MKKIFFLFLLISLFSFSASAFLYEIKFLTPAEIKVLTDAQIADAYLEAKIEERASAEFHEGAGFSNAKEYQKRKDLLRLIIHLRQEMQTRGMEPDPLDLWLN